MDIKTKKEKKSSTNKALPSMTNEANYKSLLVLPYQEEQKEELNLNKRRPPPGRVSNIH
jgi:hypothetical protein